jgi:WS/DGAT/MGAT family acyltransferase
MSAPPAIDPRETSRYVDSLDAGLFFGSEEHAGALSQVGALCVLDGRVDFRVLGDGFAQRIGALPRFRQVATPLPLAIGPPTWEDDPRFDLHAHVRRFEVPPPGGPQELRDAASELWSRPIDLTRPLWELTLLEGLEGQRSALLLKAHRSILDARNTVRIAHSLLAQTPDASTEPVSVAPYRPRPTSGSVGRIANAVIERVTGQPRRIASALFDLLDPERLRQDVAALAGAVESVFTLLSSPAPETPINGTLGAARRIGWVRVSLDVLRGIQGALGGTIEDATLTIIADALGRYLRTRGRQTDELDLTALVAPFGTHDPGINLLASLPVGPLRPEVRHRAIRSGRGHTRMQFQLAGMEAIANLMASLPGSVSRVLSSLAFQAVNTISISLPDLEQPLYAAGQRIRFIAPLVPLMWNVGLSFGVIHYGGAEVVIGLNADAGHIPDLTPVESALQDAYLDLAATAGVPAIDPSRVSA